MLERIHRVGSEMKEHQHSYTDTHIHTDTHTAVYMHSAKKINQSSVEIVRKSNISSVHSPLVSSPMKRQVYG